MLQLKCMFMHQPPPPSAHQDCQILNVAHVTKCWVKRAIHQASRKLRKSGRHCFASSSTAKISLIINDRSTIIVVIEPEVPTKSKPVAAAALVPCSTAHQASMHHHCCYHCFALPFALLAAAAALLLLKPVPVTV